MIPVELEGQQFSVGVQGQFAAGVTIENNQMENLIVGSNLPLSQGSLSGNTYSNVGSYLSTTSPSQIAFGDNVDYWIAETTLGDIGLVIESYASTLEFAVLVADDGSTIEGSDGTLIVQDCSGAWGGDLVVDCNGDCDGTASLDDCQVCSGGNSGHVANSDIDCNGDCFGGLVDDCNGDCGGTAFLDDCNVCSGGNTGHDADSDKDCAGVCFGDGALDECGLCNGGNSCQNRVNLDPQDFISDSYKGVNSNDPYYSEVNTSIGNTSFSGSRDQVVGIFKDNDAWGIAAWEMALQERNISYEVRPTSSLLSDDLSQFDLIITPGSDQNFSNIFSAGDLISAYVDGGGKAIISLCTQGDEGAFGSQMQVSYEGSQSDTILDESHPIMLGIENPMTGTDASHTMLSGFDASWTVLSPVSYTHLTLPTSDLV